ncbi:BQ5605_C003g02496 [Microbotryum silenes-dioicae]|uniref:Nitrogen permease regulator 3 n=1 Tax=Microbotryum silenes-dioicae TaxID=796604 RepID=A0A2X0NYZ6_9BASI|nr:BQ5605_C003g02496 [Microbotryum silenes-dioicae]
MVEATASPASSLLALLLVVKSSRGANVVYQYPPSPRAVKRTSKPIYHSSRPSTTTTVNTRQSGYSSDEDESSSSLSDTSSGDEDDEDDSDDEARFVDDLDQTERAKGQQYLGFPSTVLASLLSPSRELCDQPFELVVDHLAFVGHPVWLGDDEPSTGLNRGPAGGRAQHRGDLHGHGSDSDSEEDGGERRGRTRRRPPPPNQGPFANLSGDFSRSSSEELGSGSGSLASNPATPPARPMPMMRNSSSTSTVHPLSSFASSDQSATGIHGTGRLLAFNFVCVIDTPPDSHLSSHLEGYYKDVIIPVTANVKALERQEQWLGKESFKLLKAIEKAHDQGIRNREIPASVAPISSLAAALNHLFEALKADQLANIQLGPLPVQVLFRGEVPIEEEYDTFYAERQEVHLKDLGPGGIGGGPERRGRHDDPIDASEAARARSVSPTPPAEAFRNHRPPPLFSRMRRRPLVRFQPWETFLPLEDPDELRKNVQPDTLLSKFLEFCSPNLSFAEYATLLDIDSDADDGALRDVVQHLVYWRKGKIIGVVSLKGVYTASSTIPLASLAQLTIDFGTQFQDLPSLPVLLSKLSPSAPFSSVIPPDSRPLRTTYYNALLFLLRNNLVEKQRTFVRLIASEAIKKEALKRWGATNASSMDGSSHLSGGGESVGMRRLSMMGSSPLGSGTRLSEMSTSVGAARSRAMSSVSVGDEEERLRLPADASESGMSIPHRGSLSGGTNPAQSPPGMMNLLSRSSGSRSGFHLGIRGPHKRTTTGKPPRSSTAWSSSSGMPGDVDDGSEVLKGPSVIVEPGRPTMLESRWIAEMTRDVEEGLRERFERMRPFLNGSHHLDEVRHRSSLTRRDVRLVLSKFEPYLIVFTHP